MDYSKIVEKIKPSIGKLYCFAGDNLIGTGSGFIFFKSNILVTCDHVIQGSDMLLCRFPDDEKFYPAKVLLRDQEHDLALVKVDDIDKTPLDKANIDKVMTGMPVLFSGFPLSLETLTTHQGILSGVANDAVGITTYLIDGTVNSGNSGCPLMNEHGEVIGVVNAKRRERSDLLAKVEKMTLGAISIHGVDLVEVYQALISNVQLGIGYAVPVSYVPEHKELEVPKKKKV